MPGSTSEATAELNATTSGSTAIVLNQASSLSQIGLGVLAGIVGETGGLLVVDRSAVIQRADDLGLFIVGVPHEPEDGAAP